MQHLSGITQFDWDSGNRDKNFQKHGVSYIECEEIFFNLPLLMLDDKKHSKTEKRFYALGNTNQNRLLFIAFTVRKNKLRVISARNMSNKEKKYYAQATKKSS
ncbi:MAG: hypothetical protein A2233_00760 [Candidatus Kerfeldbacteria bacterium RIFOXYA2_FULL_38_24]|uniref:Toxin n=1 Tax=Candidatus Kerfeldbacteria bacterium RIFOXYB2_FULL_38_14 TaxID=1798547 RepID=A0A1G2BGB1_9BACT|nr:MAG: hypothetical protein A2233_00760 [Candidatus Kerfeldbacteria bacterium RIFOXYA2_FULL_38_24]OGY88085.1 MAG: hypothetical protein A2319_01490 [Candidatus Kerfeldbacteria bacterium RIFOXYB2_FULL_38_14]OGY88443.1 MAG: hypothetical protein A2458_02365 [Candidatus Kerfeldbacteria bacterium RIFOXYC2_FULL_38_9]